MRSHDPFEVGSNVKKIVTRDGPNSRERLYKAAPSRDPRNKDRLFRSSHYYLGTSVADVIGCNLACPFCWAIDSHRRYSKTRKIGKFYSPAEVASALIETAKDFSFTYLRITQGEPTLDMEHLVKVIDNLELLESPYVFILETNGLLLGKYPKFANMLSQYAGLNSKGKPKLHVRVSIKGATPEKFHLLTGRFDQSYHKLQFKALKSCLDEGISVHPAVMLDFIDSKEEIHALRASLAEIDPSMIHSLEFERLFLEDYVIKRLKRNNIPFRRILLEA